MHVTVYQGTTTSSAKAAGATVKIRDLLCSSFLRQYTTDANGRLPDPGMPYSDYSVCAHFDLDPGAGTNFRRRSFSLVSMNDPPDVTGGQVRNIFLQDGSSQSGTCP
jgi:hypothetical protein